VRTTLGGYELAVGGLHARIDKVDDRLITLGQSIEHVRSESGAINRELGRLAEATLRIDASLKDQRSMLRDVAGSLQSTHEGVIRLRTLFELPPSAPEPAAGPPARAAR
jgi:hypothetical protein